MSEGCPRTPDFCLGSKGRQKLWVHLLITVKQISPSLVQSPHSEFYRTQESAGPSTQLSLDRASLMVSGAAQSDRLQPGPTVQGPLTPPGDLGQVMRRPSWSRRFGPQERFQIVFCRGLWGLGQQRAGKMPTAHCPTTHTPEPRGFQYEGLYQTFT